MCGIAGLLGPPAQGGEALVRDMLHVLRHRGPDDQGVWGGEGAWLGHRRLSIIDTSAAGHQPMVSACGRYVISLNGEIYNYPALREDVAAAKAIAWRGHSDTEVLVEAIAHFGVEGAVRRAAGMFAFAVWDRQERAAWLARDRFGEKPLYWASHRGGLAFASELTALERLRGLCGDLDPAALSLFFRYGYVPAPYGIYRAVHKLEPGCLLRWKEGETPATTPFWRLGDLVEAGQVDRLTDPEQAVDELDRRLRAAVEGQMVSDVPLGAFLSGGIDSSLVVAIMQAVSPRPARTFTLGFDSPEFNEAEHALAVAGHLGTDHTEHYVTTADAQAIVPSLGAIYDEPFADASQIPTWLISRIAREQVTVCLTGDGGDEMFGGYVRYPGVPRLWNAIKGLPARSVAASALESLPLGFIDGAMGFLGPLARQYTSRGALGPSVRRAAGWLRAKSRDELFEMTMSAWSSPEALLLDPGPASASGRPPAPGFKDDLEAMMWRDSVDYLPGDILCKVDRAAMAHGLETRVPFLDPAIAAFAWRAPASMKIRGGQTKWLLRQVLNRYVPSALIDRPKMGFSVPLHAWLTGDLRDWAMSLIDPAVIRRQGMLDPQAVAAVWRAFLAGDSGLSHRVWTVLMFQAWQAERGR
jgi:asparagine synthase (glutamine-hydrolysing)